MPFFVLGRRWPPAPAGKFSPHAGAATHGNGISKLATHPPQHADAPSLQLAAVVLSPFPSHRRAPAGKFSPHADALTHGNGISALATHPPLHADVPSLCWKEPPPFCPPREATVKKIFLGTWIFLLKLGKKKKSEFFSPKFLIFYQY